MSQKISLFDLLLSSKLTKGNCTSHIQVYEDVKEILVKTGMSPEDETELNLKVHYLTNLFRRKKEDLKHGVVGFAEKNKRLLEDKNLKIKNCSSMEKVISKYQFGVKSTKFGQITKCEVCTKEGQIMGTTNLCQTCLNKAMEKAKHLLKNELVQKQMPRKEERRKRRHSWSFLDRNREEQVPDNPFLPLLPERYKIPKKGTKEEWNGELWRKYICPNE